jgi:hypothetical protein
MTTDNIQAALDTYEQVMEACSEQIMRANYDLAASIRGVLLPILHRWGMGMLLGGTMVYQQPSIKAMAEDKWEVQLSCPPSTMEVHKDKEDDYALQAVHPKVHDALWKNPGLQPYPHNATTMHDFMMAIPLPGVEAEYIWITEDEDGHWDTVTFVDSVVGPAHDLIYCGPITQAYWEDIKGCDTVGPFIDVLPAYKYSDGDFVRYYQWNEAL